MTKATHFIAVILLCFGVAALPLSANASEDELDAVLNSIDNIFADFDFKQIQKDAVKKLGKARIAHNIELTELIDNQGRLAQVMVTSKKETIKWEGQLLTQSEALEALNKITKELNIVASVFIKNYGEEAFVRHLLKVPNIFLETDYEHFNRLVLSKIVLVSKMIKLPENIKPELSPELLQFVVDEIARISAEDDIVKWAFKNGLPDEQRDQGLLIRLNKSNNKVQRNILESLRMSQIRYSIINGMVALDSPWRHLVDNSFTYYDNFIYETTHSSQGEAAKNIPPLFFLFKKPPHSRKIYDSLEDLLENYSNKTCTAALKGNS